VKLYKQRSTKSIGTISNPQLSPVLIGKALAAPMSRAGAFAMSTMKFPGFFLNHNSLPESGVKIAASMVLAQHKGH
jgi:hypothetical protein